jgi:hypothetical protein
MDSSAYNPPPAASAVESGGQAFVGGVGVVGKTLEGINIWQIVLTILVLSITYDQGTKLTHTAFVRTLNG